MAFAAKAGCNGRFIAFSYRALDTIFPRLFMTFSYSPFLALFLLAAPVAAAGVAAAGAGVAAGVAGGGADIIVRERENREMNNSNNAFY